MRSVCPACEYVAWDNPKPAVGVVIEKGAKVLFVRRERATNCRCTTRWRDQRRRRGQRVTLDALERPAARAAHHAGQRPRPRTTSTRPGPGPTEVVPVMFHLIANVVLRRGWLNVDRLWAYALGAGAAATLFI